MEKRKKRIVKIKKVKIEKKKIAVQVEKVEKKKISPLDRYQRQIRFREIGPASQEELMKKSVAIVGLGATGSQVAQILARAGVGKLRLIDRDALELVNLQAQLYREDQLSLPKAIAAAELVKEANSSITVEPVVAHIDAENIVQHLTDVDLILDCSDSMETRYVINDFSLARKIPWIYAAAISSIGVVLPIVKRQGWACFRCLFPKEPEPALVENVEQIGILAPASSIAAAIQSMEALKFLIGKLEMQELSYFNVWTGEISRLGVVKIKDCLSCGQGKYNYLGELGKRNVVPIGLNSWHVKGRGQLDFLALKERLKQVGDVKSKEGVIHFKSPEFELSIFRDGRAIVKNADSAEKALEIYSRVVV